MYIAIVRRITLHISTCFVKNLEFSRLETRIFASDSKYNNYSSNLLVWRSFERLKTHKTRRFFWYEIENTINMADALSEAKLRIQIQRILVSSKNLFRPLNDENFFVFLDIFWRGDKSKGFLSQQRHFEIKAFDSLPLVTNAGISLKMAGRA